MMASPPLTEALTKRRQKEEGVMEGGVSGGFGWECVVFLFSKGIVWLV